MSQENLELVRAGYRAFNERDPEALKALLGPEGIIVELAERIGSQGPSTEP